MVFNVTFNNISIISLQSVLLVEEIGVPRENHWTAAINWNIVESGVSSQYNLNKCIHFRNVFE